MKRKRSTGGINRAGAAYPVGRYAVAPSPERGVDRGKELWYSNPCNKNIAEWSSPVARRAHNPKVVGSNPASATNNRFDNS